MPGAHASVSAHESPNRICKSRQYGHMHRAYVCVFLLLLLDEAKAKLNNALHICGGDVELLNELLTHACRMSAEASERKNGKRFESQRYSSAAE